MAGAQRANFTCDFEHGKRLIKDSRLQTANQLQLPDGAGALENAVKKDSG